MAKQTPNGYDRHHLWFEAREYKDHSYFFQLRQSAIVTMRWAGHQALHRAVEPPPKPTMGEVADFLDAYYQEEPPKGVESFEFTEEFFAHAYLDDIADQERRERCLAIANNIARQLVFVKGNLWLP